MCDLFFLLRLFFILIWNILSLYWICYNIVSVFLFGFLVFWPQGMWDLSSRPGIEHTPLALESEPVDFQGRRFIMWFESKRITYHLFMEMAQSRASVTQCQPRHVTACLELLACSPQRWGSPQKGQGWHSPHCTVCKPFSLWREDASPGDSTWVGENILQDEGRGLVCKTRSGPWPCREEELHRSWWGDAMFQPSSFWPY